MKLELVSEHPVWGNEMCFRLSRSKTQFFAAEISMSQIAP
jgi:hypothetical protein